MNWRDPGIPAKWRRLYEKGRRGSAKTAIRAMCGMCVGWEGAEVDRCTATGCPLYNLRNLAAQAKTEEADRAKRREMAKASGARPPRRCVDEWARRPRRRFKFQRNGKRGYPPTALVTSCVLARRRGLRPRGFE